MPTALITGASRGIGRSTVDAFRAAGWRCVAGVRDPASLEVADPEVLVVQLDVTDSASIASAVAAAQEFAEGALDAVVNNAGYALVGTVEDVAMDEVRAVFDTNTFGALAVTQAALPAMRRAGGGAVVFVSTVGAHLPTPLLGAYRASKAALNALADVLALECRPFGIRVSCVEPGMVATEFSASTRRSGSVTDPNGPYAPLAGAFLRGLGEWRAQINTDPAVVAAEIVRVATERHPDANVLVGDDAKQLRGMNHDTLLGFLGIEWPIVRS